MALGADELGVILQSVAAMPAPGWVAALYGDPKLMPRPGESVVFVDDFTKGR